jgi:hypothetical protein
LLALEFRAGAVRLPALDLWLDAHEPITGSDRVFVSHAHSDHTAAHREVILSEPTRRFLRERVGGARIEHVAEFHQPIPFHSRGVDWQLTLLPAVISSGAR